jgi:alanine dehydrogenase
MVQIPANRTVEKNTADIIERIAAETHRPIDEVKRVYDHEYARLKSEARVFDYVALFASRNTRAVLARIH